ncbi:MAG TPA: hypothetical protein VFG63_15335 [Nocardioidaceae bacterium]|nr:hypothetical protein [Nocardioidaceae bacterium]
MSAATNTPPSPVTVPSPPARRTPPATWRDPRLVVGIVIVAVSVLFGAQLFARADDTVAVWAVRSDLPGGTAVGADDLERREIRFGDAVQADLYVSASSPVPVGSTLVHDVGAGELLPRAALGDAGAAALVEVPVAVPSESVPATVRAGSVVDVWVTPDGPGTAQAESVQVFDDVVVVAAPRSGSALGPSATRQVIVGVDGEQENGLAEALARAATGTIVITRQG